MSGNVYLLDENVLIAAKNSYYGFDICPGFWDLLLSAHGAKRVFSIAQVQDELLKGDDDLTAWVDALPMSFFKSCDSAVSQFGAMQRWAALSTQYLPAAKEQFAKAADGWLIALAKLNGYTVVTHERLQPEARARIPMPNVCKDFSVSYMNTFDMLKAMKVSFALKK